MFRKAMDSIRTLVFVSGVLLTLAPRAADAQAGSGTLYLALEYSYHPFGEYVPDTPLTLTPTGACAFQNAVLFSPFYYEGLLTYEAEATVTVPFLFHNDESVEIGCGFMLSDAHQSVLIDHLVYVPDEPVIYYDPLGTIRANVSQNGFPVAQGLVIADTRTDYYVNYGQYVLPASVSVFPTSALIMLASKTYGVQFSYDPYITLTTTSYHPGVN